MKKFVFLACVFAFISALLAVSCTVEEDGGVSYLPSNYSSTATYKSSYNGTSYTLSFESSNKDSVPEYCKLKYNGYTFSGTINSGNPLSDGKTEICFTTGPAMAFDASGNVKIANTTFKLLENYSITISGGKFTLFGMEFMKQN